MPELPDITVYVEAIADRVVGRRFVGYAMRSPFFLRTVDPPLDALVGRRVIGVSRLGKRIVIALEDESYLVIHLMIAGRLRWVAADAKGKKGGAGAVAELAFESGTLVVTEAGSKRRASLHAMRGREALAAVDRGGLEVLESDEGAFAARLTSENHTLKRALTDPRLFSGIGNAYSDEMLHRARLSPLKLTRSLGEAEITRLREAVRATLIEWTDRLRAESNGGFPERVTAFREGMAVHGRFRQPCPDCGAPIQRIRYADNETNYCARCQTEGRLLADRALSRLLKEDWPRRLEDVEG